MPALTRVASRISSARLHQLPGSYWNTTSRNEFDPMSMTARRSIGLMIAHRRSEALRGPPSL